MRCAAKHRYGVAFGVVQLAPNAASEDILPGDAWLGALQEAREGTVEVIVPAHEMAPCGSRLVGGGRKRAASVLSRASRGTAKVKTRARRVGCGFSL